MKVSLEVLEGPLQGKSIPITLPQFLIGRGPGCHLRPASPVISKRHCALLIRDDRVILQDLASTNGATVNDLPVRGKCELHHGDRLTLGPLRFLVRIEADVPAPGPSPEADGATDEEAMAALLLEPEAGSGGGGPVAGPEGLAAASTILDASAAPTNDTKTDQEPLPPDPAKARRTPPAAADTAKAASAILEKYLRRPRA